MSKTIGIYRITSPTNKLYIGQSTDCEQRIRKYKNGLCKTQTKLLHSIKKYGWEAHKFEVIHECSKEELNDLEVYYIKIYNTFNTEHGMNLQSGGNSPLFSDETRIKLSQNHRKTQTQETRDKLSRLLKGKKKSDEHVLNNRLCRLGVPRNPHTEETKAKIRESNKKRQKEIEQEKLTMIF